MAKYKMNENGVYVLQQYLEMKETINTMWRGGGLNGRNAMAAALVMTVVIQANGNGIEIMKLVYRQRE